MGHLKNSKFLWPTRLLAVALILTAAVCTVPASPRAAYANRIVAVDPGHGGRDHGAQGPGGTLEKDVCLALAKQLAAQLTAYDIVMTRSDDYSMENRKRASLANHNKSDILVSLHTGAGFLHSTTGAAVYYYQPISSDAPQMSAQPEDNRMRWQHIQTAHTAASTALAAQIQQALQGPVGPAPVKIRPAPLVVLQGAAMPAVLIEIGQLTNPATEKALTSPDQLKAYAKAIAAGIEAFFAAKHSSARP